MSSSVPLGGQKRSISSSIVEFFTKPAERRITNTVDDKIGARGLHNKRSTYDIFEEQDVENLTAGVVGHVDFPPSEAQGSLIIYETDSNVRPPLLPILPIQRLRLLRQKQEWRRRQNSNMLFSLSSQVPSIGAPAAVKLYTADTLSPNTSRFSHPSSSTPSPIKQNTLTGKNNATKEKWVHNRVLKRKKIAGGAKHGTKWSGEFEYDLSEYDNIVKERKEPMTSHIDSPTLSMTKPSSAGSIIDQDINSDKLSATQKNILLKGPESLLSKKEQRRENKITTTLPKDTAGLSSMGFKGERGSGKDSDKTILPSVGFDFIKDNDTPSKQSSPQKLNASYDKQASSVPLNDIEDKRASSAAVKPLMSFSLPKSNEDSSKSKDSTSMFNFKPIKSDKKTSTSSLPSFSFGNNNNNAKQMEKPSGLLKQDQKIQPAFALNKQSRVNKEGSDEDQDEPKRKRPVHVKEGRGDEFAPTAGAPSIQKANEKIHFSFGGGSQEENNVRSSPENREKETSSLTTTNPSFSFGGKGNKPSESESGSTDTNKANVPAGLVLGGNQKNDGGAKRSFAFGSKDTDDTIVKPLFAFDANNSTVKPKFTFGATNDHGDKSGPKLSSNPTDTKEAPVQISKPSFSFKSGDVSDGKTKPSFSFGTAPDNATTNSIETSAASSNVAAVNPDASKLKSASRPPAFSFNRISDANNETGNELTSPFSLDKKEIPPPRAGFSFSSNATADNGTTVSSTAPAVQNSNVDGGLSFSKSGLQAGAANAWAGPAASNTNSNGSFNFKFGETNSGSKVNAPSPQPSISGANPFIGAPKGTNGFSFGPTITKPNGASVFNSSQPTFGGGTTPSPSFGKSATPPVLAGSNVPSRAFSPSSTVNLNFGSTATADPSSIFSGGLAQPAAGPPAPQYTFGSTPPPSQIFGGAPQQPNAPFGNGMAGGEPTQPIAASNFQIPPGRKLARMRHARRG